VKKILAISGSIKPNSSNYRLLTFIAETMKAEAHVEIYSGLTRLPYFEPGLQDEQLPEAVQSFLTKIDAADAVLIATPEYVFSIPGVLKNALEWTVAGTAFSDKPVAIIVAASQGEKALASLDVIMSTLAQSPLPRGRKLIVQSPGRHFDGDGNLTNEDVKAQVLALVRDLMNDDL
jgi:chromate reductase